MKVKKILLFSFIIFGIFFSLLLSNNVKASLSDINYNFQRDLLINESEPSLDHTFNLAYSTYFTNNYSASYSMENDTQWNHPNHFEIIEGSGSSVSVINELDGHNKVIYLNTTTTGSTHYPQIKNYFYEGSESYGTIEFWWQSSNVDLNHANYIIVNDGATNVIRMNAQFDEWNYWDGNPGSQKVIPNVPIPLDNIWQHIRIDFELTGGGYLGMAQYKCIITINGISSGAINLQNNQANVNSIRYACSGWHSNYEQYIDSLGYSWLSNYTLTENLVPEIITDTSMLKVDRFEFAYEGKTQPNTITPLLSDNVSGFIDIETGGGDKVNIFYHNSTYNRNYLIQDNTNGAVRGIKRENIDINTQPFFNISFKATFLDMNGANNYFSLIVESYDETQVLHLTFLNTGLLRWYNSDTTTFITLRDDIVEFNEYEINCYFNYNDDIIIIRYSVNGTYITNYQIPIYPNGKIGLDYVGLAYYINSADLNVCLIDYVGIYSNGTSLTEEYGIALIDLGVAQWNYEDNNLVNINGTGMFAIGSAQSLSEPYLWNSSTYTAITGFMVYGIDNSSFFTNIYDNYEGIISNPLLMISVAYNFSLSFISVEGVKLVEGINEYFLSYQHDEKTDPDESYFYVNNNNRLQFIHIANNTDLEYIQAEFNIQDISSQDYAIKFKSNIDYNAYGYFRVKFTDVSNFIPIPIYDTTTRFFLSQNKTINSFIILITDDDIDSVIGFTNGYVSHIQLLYITDIGISITTSSLLDLLIPIIIIFIPTFILTQGSKYKNMIVPLMMLMSIVCVINNIIPYWLFFIIMFSSSLFLFLKRSEGVF